MLEAQKQQHLRTLRRGLNRAVSALKAGERVICHSGLGYGVAFTHPWLQAIGPDGADFLRTEIDEPCYLFLPEGEFSTLQGLLHPGLERAASFFWPGPLLVRTRLVTLPDGRVPRLVVTVPWHPLMQELLARHGALLWRPLSEERRLELERLGENVESLGDDLVLLWPEREVTLKPTLLDISSKPWRLLSQGFVGVDELVKRIEEPLVLSMERAFPARAIQTYIPEGKTFIVEAADRTHLPEAIQRLRSQVPPDAFVRIYLDETTAHNHFPDDREVRVYGELDDPERVRRRLQAMLERQNRRLGKRVLLIAVAELGPGTESFRIDLEKLGDGWLKVEETVDLPL